MSAPSQAVFLSYASEDGAAAKRIATALRQAGLEVWFDQSDLGGGDAWDAKIKQQIQSCALFVPIVSKQTQARAEGYFRLEWLLAVERTKLMGRTKAFLVPVCIDGTRESEADVPEAFLGVQWTRLAGGEAPPEFVERVRRLLGGAANRERKPEPVAPRDGGASRRREEALAALRAVLAGPCGWSPHEIRHDPLFSRLKDDPRFEEMLAAAKSL
jgi:hypothetical protein